WTNESVVGIGIPSIESETRGPPPSDDELLGRVREGVASCDHAGSDFPLDGTRHLFSTLRPEAGTAGALRLTIADRNVVNAAVFLTIAIVGSLLTPRPVGTRLWWLAGIVVGIVLVAVFAPTLAEAILTTPLWLAIGLVLLVWLVRYLAWFVPGCAA